MADFPQNWVEGGCQLTPLPSNRLALLFLVPSTSRSENFGAIPLFCARV